MINGLIEILDDLYGKLLSEILGKPVGFGGWNDARFNPCNRLIAVENYVLFGKFCKNLWQHFFGNCLMN